MVTLLAAWIATEERLDFRPRLPKAGSVFEYRVYYRTNSSQGPTDYHSQIREKVLGVRPDGSYVLQTETVNEGAKTPTVKVLSHYDPLGRVAPREKPVIETDPRIRVANGVARFYVPSRMMRVGDRYGRMLSSNDGEGWNDATLAYEVVRVEKWQGQDVARIAFTYHEKFSKAYFAGYWLIRTRDARVVSLRANGTEVPFSRSVPPGNAFLAMDLTSER